VNQNVKRKGPQVSRKSKKSLDPT